MQASARSQRHGPYSKIFLLIGVGKYFSLFLPTFSHFGVLFHVNRIQAAHFVFRTRGLHSCICSSSPHPPTRAFQGGESFFFSYHFSHHVVTRRSLVVRQPPNRSRPTLLLSLMHHVSFHVSVKPQRSCCSSAIPLRKDLPGAITWKRALVA